MRGNQITMFQINREDQDPTVAGQETKGVLHQESELPLPPGGDSGRQTRITVWLETSLIFLCFALVAGQLPPDVNESHYLTKAKHYWDPNWCAGDIFLGSSFAHWIFFVSSGWLANFFSLSAVAWIGRVITWGLLSFAWQRFTSSLLPAKGLSILSAIFFLLLNERFHLAGEWVVGGFEAKGLAYFFVLMALGSAVQRKWNWAWPMLGCAMAFHVLVGGWAFIALTFAWIAMRWSEFDSTQPGTKKRWVYFLNGWDDAKQQVGPFCVGAAIGLIGLIPPLLADRTADPEISNAARMIYVNHRIAHHLTFDAFPTFHIARFSMIVVFCYLLHCWLKSRWPAMHRRFRPVTFFCVAAMLISFGGLLLSGLAEQNEAFAQQCAGLLRFYWFRLSDFAIPAATSVLSCLIIFLWAYTDQRLTTRLSCLAIVICIVCAGGLIVMEKHRDPRPRADLRSLPSYEGDEERTINTYKNWRKVCQWIKTNTPKTSVFITPHEQQTFKWYAERSEVVCWKDIPQDALGILEWKQRLSELYEPQRRYEAGLMSYSDEQLKAIAQRYGATHLLIPQRHVDWSNSPTSLQQIYPADQSTKSTYVVFKF